MGKATHVIVAGVLVDKVGGIKHPPMPKSDFVIGVELLSQGLG